MPFVIEIPASPPPRCLACGKPLCGPPRLDADKSLVCSCRWTAMQDKIKRGLEKQFAGRTLDSALADEIRDYLSEAWSDLLRGAVNEWLVFERDPEDPDRLVVRARRDNEEAPDAK